MNNIKSYILLTWMLVSFVGCKMEDLKDDVEGLKDRVTLIEEQVKILNDNVEVLAYVLDPQQKTINSVTESNGKYVITLSDGSVLTLEAGAPGTVNAPDITVSEEGYWVVNGVPTPVKAKGEDGNNGNGIPQFRVQDGKWEVRFGSDGNWGAWEPVAGGNVAGAGDLGDQIFESAEVKGDNFVVVLANGEGTYTLPIVARLICAIDKSEQGEDGYVEFQSGEKKVIRVKIEGDGEPLAPVYPAGWRAELVKLTEADAEGYNYQLVVYAPNQTSAVSRAAADNTSEIAVRVHKGAFWAVDKIKVRLPKVYANDYDRYEDGQSILVGGLEINKSVHGDATIISGNQEIKSGGVYFVDADDVTLTCKGGEFENLVILPKTDKVASITLNVTSAINLSGDFVCKKVHLNKNGGASLIDAKSEVSFVIEEGKIEDSNSTKPWVLLSDVTASMAYFYVSNSDIKLNNGGMAGAFISASKVQPCKKLVFENNIVFYAQEVNSETLEDAHFVNFKLFSGQNTVLSEALVNNNTFVDVETTYANGVTGMIYAKSIEKLEINRNLYYLTYPRTDFSGKQQTTTVLIRSTEGIPSASGANNYGYCGNPTMKTLKMSYAKLPEGLGELTVVKDNLLSTIDKATGTFIPSDDYKIYGAQR